MNFLHRLRAWLASRRPKPLSEWFFVSFDENVVRIRAEPPGRASGSQKFTWASVVRVCFKAEDLFVSDGIYVFTAERPESYVVPTEASGGNEFWSEIVRRGLFDVELAIQVASATEGLFCWPSEEPPA